MMICALIAFDLPVADIGIAHNFRPAYSRSAMTRTNGLSAGRVIIFGASPQPGD
jgi:hypothetical protein